MSRHIPTNTEWAAGPRKPFPSRIQRPSRFMRLFLGTMWTVVSATRMTKELARANDMLLTLATMAIRMDDMTGHDVIEALRALGYGHVVATARQDDFNDQTTAVD
jgi:CheY-like chemotaxis protein